MARRTKGDGYRQAANVKTPPETERSKYFHVKRPARRTCLRCCAGFQSVDVFNRICASCRQAIEQHATDWQRHKGEE